MLDSVVVSRGVATRVSGRTCRLATSLDPSETVTAGAPSLWGTAGVGDGNCACLKGDCAGVPPITDGGRTPGNS